MWRRITNPMNPKLITRMVVGPLRFIGRARHTKTQERTQTQKRVNSRPTFSWQGKWARTSPHAGRVRTTRSRTSRKTEHVQLQSGGVIGFVLADLVGVTGGALRNGAVAARGVLSSACAREWEQTPIRISPVQRSLDATVAKKQPSIRLVVKQQGQNPQQSTMRQVHTLRLWKLRLGS